MITKQDWEDRLKMSKEDYAKGEAVLKDTQMAMSIIEDNIRFIKQKIHDVKP